MIELTPRQRLRSYGGCLSLTSISPRLTVRFSMVSLWLLGCLQNVSWQSRRTGSQSKKTLNSSGGSELCSRRMSNMGSSRGSAGYSQPYPTTLEKDGCSCPRRPPCWKLSRSEERRVGKEC